MLVVKTDRPATALPYGARAEEVDEDKIKSLGEVSELKPGKSGSLTLDLKPGSYLLLCNQPGHMRHGMWARFEVTPRQG
ncbi:MAG TPA: sulfocyanin-like copper-binding protein [Roseiarcus sp.]|nr:sulfocyanin-like copper-binding protein [Roseiarcus sp.]